MPHVRNVVALLCFIPIANGLVRSRVSNSLPDERSSLNATVDTSKVASEEVALSSRSDATHSYYTCSDSNNCNVNTTKMKAELQSGLILFLGCSLDIYAIKHFCNSAQSNLVGFTNNFAYMAYCSTGGFTLVYVFQPGATAPPYWRDYVGTLNSQQIIGQSAHDIVRLFGREPTAIVVDASLWDVSNWWQKAGMPPEPYPVPHTDLARWCHTDVPQLLSWVSASYPRSRVAFRTAPPVFGGNGYGQSPAIVTEMIRCVREWAFDYMTRKVYKNYHLLDYNQLVETFFLHHSGPQMSFYKDVLHPGRELSMEYINEVLKWVRSFNHDGGYQKIR